MRMRITALLFTVALLSILAIGYFHQRVRAQTATKGVFIGTVSFAPTSLPLNYGNIRSNNGSPDSFEDCMVGRYCRSGPVRRDRDHVTALAMKRSFCIYSIRIVP